MSKKYVDEWGVVINKQAELNKQRELEEKQRAQQDRERYKLDLEHQANFHALKKAEELRQKELEAQEIKQQFRSFEQSEYLKKHQQSEFQRSLADEYSSQTNSLKTRHQQELLTKLNEEKQQILYKNIKCTCQIY